MSYNIYKSDGTTIIISDAVVNQDFNNSGANAGKGIGVQFVGFDSPNYVIPIAQNFLQITENFCGTILPPDAIALHGQLWFNRLSPTNGSLYVRISNAGVGGLANWREVVVGDTTVVPGSYTNSNVTVNAQGRITSITNGAGGGGGGTVTSVSVVTANGVSGSVATATTTPAISLTLGAITPTSVASTGTVTGTNLSGTNTGDQTLNSLLPAQPGNAGRVLTTDGSNTSWADSGAVPYYIPPLETFIVPVNKQALFSIPIINDGTIIVDGYLVGV